MSINSPVNISMSCHIFNASRSDAVTVCASFLFSPFVICRFLLLFHQLFQLLFRFFSFFFFKLLRGMCENAAMSPKPSVTKRISGAISFAGDVSNSINNKRSQTININYTPNTASTQSDGYEINRADYYNNNEFDSHWMTYTVAKTSKYQAPLSCIVGI